jgi:hypothetical protein
VAQAHDGAAVAVKRAAEPVPADADWRAGFFSNGDLDIDVGDTKVTMKSAAARGFVAWLLKLDRALQP